MKTLSSFTLPPRPLHDVGWALLTSLAVAGLLLQFGILGGLLIYALLGAAGVVLIALRSPSATIGLWLLTTEGARLLPSSALLIGGGIDAKLSDPVLFGIAVALVLLLLDGDRTTYRVFFRTLIAWTLLVAWLLARMVGSIDDFGVVSAIGEFRTYFHHILILPYLLVTLTTMDQVRRVFCVVTGLALSLIAVGFLQGGVAYGFSFAPYQKWLGSMASLATGFGAIALYLMQRYGRWPYGLLLHTLLLMLVLVLTIISGHRSVWMALGAGIAVLALLGHVPVAKMIKLAIGATFLILLLDTIYANYDIIAFLQERTRAFVAAREDSTATWRLYIWQDAWEQSKNHLVLGKGLGNYFNVTDHRGLTVRASLHNQYLQFIYQVGLVGLGLYVLFVFGAMRQLLAAYRSAPSADVAMMTATALVVLVSASVFYLAYGFDFFTWVFVGIGFAAAEQARAAVRTGSTAVIRT